MIFLQSQPHLALQKFIGQYISLSFNTAILPSLRQTFLPYDIPAITFFVGPVFLDHTMAEVTGPISVPFSQSISSYYVGLVTSPFSIYFKENQEIKALMIAFKPSGFSALFQRDIAELTDRIPDFSLLTGESNAALFFEQLIEAKDFSAQVTILNNFFIKRIAGRRYQSEQITEACKRLMLSNGMESMTSLAYQTNMSLRNLERRFTEQVGVSPKIFARFKRFHHALSLMNRETPLSFRDIAYKCGYYDQAHFVKEFKTLSKQSPSSYSPYEYLLYNQFILFRNFSSF